MFSSVCWQGQKDLNLQQWFWRPSCYQLHHTPIFLYIITHFFEKVNTFSKVSDIFFIFVIYEIKYFTTPLTTQTQPLTHYSHFIAFPLTKTKRKTIPLTTQSNPLIHSSQNHSHISIPHPNCC